MAKKTFETGTAPVPGQDSIARRAHEIWENEGCPDGRALEHWFRAVSELTAPRDAGLPKPAEPKSRTSRRGTPGKDERRFQAGQ